MTDPVDLLPGLYEASVESDQWAAFLRSMADFVDAQLATLIARDESSKRCTVVQIGATLIPPVSCLANSQHWTCCHAFILFVALAWSASLANAQGFDATNLRQPTDLATGWLVRAGDDPAYARPDYDDSPWTPFNAQTDDLLNVFPSRPEVVWYRLHVKVAPTQAGMALLESGISRTFEVYSNGVKLIQAGRIQPYVAYDTDARLFAPIPDNQTATGSIILALRVHIDAAEWSYPRPGYWSSNLTLGMGSTLHEHAWFSTITEHALDWLDYLLNICLLLGGVMLYSTQRNRPEYMWLSLWAAAWLSLAPLSLYSEFHAFPFVWHALDYFILSFLGLFSVTNMYCAFVGHQVGWGLRLYVMAAAICTYFSDIALIWGFTLNVQLLTALPFLVLLSIVLPFIVVRGMRHGRNAERLLLTPVILIGVYFVIQDGTELMMQIPALRDRALIFLPLAIGFQVGPFHLEYYFLSDFLAKLSLALIILIRSNRMSRQQAILESEMASAREVQQVIMPEALENIPGFRIESIYEPAREVGGDFFQILPMPDGGLFLVIGDVAGKGLPAAMLVSLLVGTIRTAAEDTHAPDRLLSKMNERLIGRTRGGFSTAIAALIAADGSVSIANAGHLPPYLDGRELELPGALPLGITNAITYEVTPLRLEPASRLTFYSDGVIEAQDKADHLLGFDRARELSTQPAKTIAQAAKAFGQQDDITVITVERVAIEETHEVKQTAQVWAPSQ